MADTGPIFDAQNPSSPLSVPASKTALLLCDFHSFLVNSLPPESQACIQTADAMRQWARTQNIFIIHCLVDLDVTVAPRMKISSRAAQIQTKRQSEGAEFFAEAPTVAAGAGEYVFWRPLGNISVLNSYGLDDFLKRHDIRSLIVTGIATSGCVIDSAKAASEVGLIVSVIEDACADREAETHEFVMRKLLARQCHVVTKDAFVEAWK